MQGSTSLLFEVSYLLTSKRGSFLPFSTEIYFWMRRTAEVDADADADADADTKADADADADADIGRDEILCVESSFDVFS